MSERLILHADRHNLFRDALNIAVEALQTETDAPQLKIAQSVATGEAALKACDEQEFDIILMGLNLSDMSGYEASKEILRKHPKQKILIVSIFDTPDNIHKSIECGARGHISKSSTVEELIQAIEAVISGNKIFNSESLLKLFHGGRDGDKSSLLSSRELALLKLIYEDKSSKQMAKELKVSLRTIDHHKRLLMAKVGVKSKLALAIYATQNRLY